MIISEEQVQAKAWSIHQWMQRNRDNPWVRRVGEVWLANLWRI